MPPAVSAPRTRRWRLLMLAAALLGPLFAPVVGSPSPTLAAGNSLYFPQGSDHVVVGPNAAIFIDGTITFDDYCQKGGTRPGIDDFVYPATDVYIVTAGSAGDDAPLEDAGGNGPNTIVGTGGGAFIGELIAVTSPSGSLGEGVYDIVYDTCQDGVVGYEDEVFYDAITVVFPEAGLPPVSPSILQLKDKARQEYMAWLATHTGLTALFKLDEARAIASCLMAPSPSCLIEVWAIIKSYNSPLAQPISWFKDQTLKLVMNRAKNYGAIWQDPADPDFRQHPTLDVEEFEVPPTSGSAPADALAGLTASMVREGALADALLHAIERYQGAQSVGDAEWALVQARAVRDLSTALAEELTASTEIQDLRDALAADIDGIVERATEGAQVINRVRSTGLTPEERRTLANRGLDDAAMAALEARFVQYGFAVAPSAWQVLTMVDGLLAARSGMITALHASEAGWDEVAATVEAQLAKKSPVLLPDADAGGTYSAADGTVQLDATGSATPTGTTIVSYRWDLDGDGEFDDATGATPAVAVDGSTLAALEVTNDAGHAARDIAVISAAPVPIPTIDTALPTSGVTVVVGDSQTFAVSATGAGAAALAYEWSVDGEAVATGSPSFTYAPDAGDVGEMFLTVTVSSAGRAAVHSWWVSTIDVDVDGDGWTATTDCDDTRADVHPGNFERIGNGRDDDCDARTPDAPAGGVVGELWSWGVSYALGRTPPSGDDPTPRPVPNLGPVRSIASTFAASFAVLADGTVRSWGTGHNGKLGNGTVTHSYAPTVVQNVGGGGALGNVVAVSSDDDHALALLADGSVRAWGQNNNRQLGDGSEITTRTTPVVVLGEDDEPLSGVVQVEAGETTAYFVMADGTVKVSGVNHCDGSGITPRPRNPVATTNPLFGNQVVHLESSDHGGAIALNRDGSVFACSSYRPLLGRGEGSIALREQLTPRQVHGLGPGSGVVDVAQGSGVGVALKADGTVWMWGRNTNHELDVLGLAANYTQWVPAQVPLPPGPPVIDVSVDYAVTIFATRADGSVLVWGSNVYNGAGTGSYQSVIVGTPQIDLGGNVATAISNAMWNGLALVRPAEPGADPVLPIFWIDVTAEDTEIGESAGGEVVVSLSHPAPSDVTIEFEFDGTPGTAVVPAGATSVAVPVSVEDDAIDEEDEHLAFTVTAAAHGATIARRTAVVTVVDDDDAPVVTVGDVTVTEGDTSLTEVKLTVELSAPSGRDIVVDHSTVDGTASGSSQPGAGADFVSASGEVLIPAGSTTATIYVAVIGDTVMEPTETFTVRLVEADHATIGRDEATVSIVDDEPVTVTLTSPIVGEGDSGTTEAPFGIAVTPLLDGETVTVPWGIVPGTAELGSDVLPGSGALVFGNGVFSATVVAGVVGDTVVEELEVETFRLGVGPITSSYGRPVVVADVPVARILDDDLEAPVRSVDAGPDLSGAEGSPVSVTGATAGIDPVPASVAWTVSDPLCTFDDASALATQVTCADETVATLTLTVSVDGAALTDTATLVVANVAPSVVIDAPAPGSSHPFGSAIGVQVTVIDPGVHDVLSCSIAWGDGSPASACGTSHTYAGSGTFTITVAVDDGDGGTGTASVDVTVEDRGPGPDPDPVWEFDGFYQPVENLPVVNVVKAGSTVPLKFGLGGDHGLDIFAPGYPASVRKPCDGAPAEVLEETATPGAAQLTFDPGTGRYHYNWKTDRSWAGTCRQLVLRFADGSQAVAEFRFR